MRGQTGCEEVDVLLVADNSDDVRTVKSELSEVRGRTEARRELFTVTHVTRLGSALDLLSKREFDVVLLELRLADSQGLQTLAEVQARAAEVPVVVLTGAEDEGLSLKAVQQGAQDCIAGGPLDRRRLRRTIRYAIERWRAGLQLLRHTRQIKQAHARIERQAAELRAQTRQLDRINHDLDDFACIASHDLKEPLRGISSYCQILLEDYQDIVDAEGRHRLTSLVRMCDRLGMLIDNLLTYCRIGWAQPPDAEFDLNVGVDDVLGMFRPIIDRHRASVKVVERLPVVRGNPALIGMVLSNLVSNGLKFNESPQPRVEIGVLGDNPPTLYVRDNGIGIPKTRHEEIFTIFRRLHGRKKYEGSGVGLTIVRKIVESHGGRIWLESGPGRGTTFFFTLAPTGKTPLPKPPHWISCGTASDAAVPSRPAAT